MSPLLKPHAKNVQMPNTGTRLGSPHFLCLDTLNKVIFRAENNYNVNYNYKTTMWEEDLFFFYLRHV